MSNLKSAPSEEREIPRVPRSPDEDRTCLTGTSPTSRSLKRWVPSSGPAVGLGFVLRYKQTPCPDRRVRAR